MMRVQRADFVARGFAYFNTTALMSHRYVFKTDVNRTYRSSVATARWQR